MAITDSQLAAANIADRYGADGNRRTLSKAMGLLLDALRLDDTFAKITLSESGPDEQILPPRIVWKLKSRIAGAGGMNSKNPFRSEEIPLEDGRILVRRLQPQTFEVSFEIYHSLSAGADDLRDLLEAWLMENRALTAQCGFESFQFLCEQEPGVVESGASSKIQRRSLHFNGVINYYYPQIFGVINSVRTRRETGWDKHTQLLTRGAQDSDISPVTGPLVLVALHNDPLIVAADYLNELDFLPVVDRERFGTQFMIRWLPRGIQPASGASYYMTYLVPTHRTVSLDTPTSGRVRRARPRGPSILGQEIDPASPQRGQTILTATGGLKVAGQADLMEALTQAETQVVTVLSLPT